MLQTVRKFFSPRAALIVALGIVALTGFALSPRGHSRASDPQKTCPGGGVMTPWANPC